MSIPNTEDYPSKIYEEQPKAIPYQLCPKCNGTGRMECHPMITSVWEICDVCNGAKIIPMFQL